MPHRLRFEKIIFVFRVAHTFHIPYYMYMSCHILHIHIMLHIPHTFHRIMTKLQRRTRVRVSSNGSCATTSLRLFPLTSGRWVNVSVSVCVCVYVYNMSCATTSPRIFPQISNRCVCVCVCVCVCFMHVCIYMYIYVHMYACMNMCVYILVYILVYMYVYMYMCMCM